MKNPLTHVANMAAIGEQVVEIVRDSKVLHKPKGRKKGTKVKPKKKRKEKEVEKKPKVKRERPRDEDENEETEE